MPFVKLLYGPHETNGIIRHKTQRIHGLIQSLTKLNYEIEIIPNVHLDRLTIEMSGREVFRCSIKNFLFNIDCEDDVICQRAVDSVQEAATRLYDKSNVASYYPVSRGKRIVQEIKNARTAQDLFDSDVIAWFEIPKRSLVSLPGEVFERNVTVNVEN